MDCDTHPTYLGLDQITYVTNIETGLKLIKIEDQGEMEYNAQSFYSTIIRDFSEKPFIVTDMEKLELINLANTATEFHFGTFIGIIELQDGFLCNGIKFYSILL